VYRKQVKQSCNDRLMRKLTTAMRTCVNVVLY